MINPCRRLVGDRYKLGERQCFRAPGGVKAERLPILCAAPGFETLPQHLAPLGEGGGDQARKMGRIPDGQRGVGFQPHQTGIDFRGREKRPGGHREKRSHRAPGLHHDRQTPAGRIPWCSRQAIDHLLLQEEHHRLYARLFDQVKNKRRRNVIGQIADDAQRGADPAQIETERIGLVDGETVAETSRQGRRQIPIDLDGVQPVDARKQMFGQRAPPGSDLHGDCARHSQTYARDSPENLVVEQKVLAKSLLRR